MESGRLARRGRSSSLLYHLRRGRIGSLILDSALMNLSSPIEFSSSMVGVYESRFKTLVLMTFLTTDTPYPIDPFTFISASQGKPQKTSKETSVAISPTFAIPSLPDRLLATSSTTTTATPLSSSTTTPAP